MVAAPAARAVGELLEAVAAVHARLRGDQRARASRRGGRSAGAERREVALRWRAVCDFTGVREVEEVLEQLEEPRLVSIRVGDVDVRITHPERRLWAEYTRRDLLKYLTHV